MTKVEKSEVHKKKIIELLYQSIENLIQNPFGNYIIQHALDVFPKECNNILDRIVDKVIQYSNQKFSSNVVEKCLVFASEVPISSIP
jgi:Pumilio-family RNA binding repeat